MLNLAMDSKLKGCDLFRLRIDDVFAGGRVPDRARISTDRASNPRDFSTAVTGRKLSANGLPKADTSPLPD
jgi:hypothetical protein